MSSSARRLSVVRFGPEIALRQELERALRVLHPLAVDEDLEAGVELLRREIGERKPGQVGRVLAQHLLGADELVQPPPVLAHRDAGHG